MKLQDLSNSVKNFLDWLSLGAVAATLAAWLPPMAALASLIWTVIRIYETETFQGWLRKWRVK